MNLGVRQIEEGARGAGTALGEVERLRYETEMKLLMQEKQKLEEQMMWRQREQQMRDQMFQMMVMMQAGGKVDPQELMKQYFIIQQQMNPNAAVSSFPPQPVTQPPIQSSVEFNQAPPEFHQAQQAPSQFHQAQLSPPQFLQAQPFQPANPGLGSSESERSLGGSRGRMPATELRSDAERNETFKVQTQFRQLPQIIHPGGALPEPTDRSDFTLPQSNTFLPHSEMASVNSSAFAHNIHSKLDQEELEKSLTSETKLIAAVTNTEGRLRKKLKQLQSNPEATTMSAMMSETWVPQQVRVEDHISENSNDKFDTFRQNMKDINEQIERLDHNLQKKQSECESGRSSIRTESVKSGTGTFNFQNTGQYSPMSTDKRKTFYDQIKSLEITESQLPQLKDVTVVSEAAPAEESFTDYAESSYIQQNMRDIEERVEKELQQEGFVKKAQIVKTPTITNISENEGIYIKENEKQARVIRKSWSKQREDRESKVESEDD